MQSYNDGDSFPIFSDFNLKYLLTINAPPYIEKQSPKNCINIQSKCIFMQKQPQISLSFDL